MRTSAVLIVPLAAVAFTLSSADTSDVYSSEIPFFYRLPLLPSNSGIGYEGLYLII